MIARRPPAETTAVRIDGMAHGLMRDAFPIEGLNNLKTFEPVIKGGHLRRKKCIQHQLLCFTLCDVIIATVSLTCRTKSLLLFANIMSIPGFEKKKFLFLEVRGY